MKRLFLLYIALVLSLTLFSQRTIVTDQLIVRSQIKVAQNAVKGISIDSLFGSTNHDSLVTQRAIKLFVERSIEDSLAAFSSSPWTVLGSDIYYNSGNVGVLNTSPQYPLDLGGSGASLRINPISSAPIASDGVFYVNSNNNLAYYYIDGAWKALGSDNMGNHNAAQDVIMGSHSIRNNAAQYAARLKFNGNDDIKLENWSGVNYVNVDFSGGTTYVDLEASTSSSGIRFRRGSVYHSLQSLFGGNAFVFKTEWSGGDPVAQIYFNRSNTDPWMRLGVGTPGNLQHIITLDKDYEVGIGTTTPSYKLDVAGPLRLLDISAPSNSLGVIYTSSITERLHFMDGVTDNTLAYTSEIPTSYWTATSNDIFNTNTESVFIGSDGTGFQETTLGITGQGSTAIRINGPGNYIRFSASSWRPYIGWDGSTNDGLRLDLQTSDGDDGLAILANGTQVALAGEYMKARQYAGSIFGALTTFRGYEQGGNNGADVEIRGGNAIGGGPHISGNVYIRGGIANQAYTGGSTLDPGEVFLQASPIDIGGNVTFLEGRPSNTTVDVYFPTIGQDDTQTRVTVLSSTGKASWRDLATIQDGNGLFDPTNQADTMRVSLIKVDGINYEIFGGGITFSETSGIDSFFQSGFNRPSFEGSRLNSTLLWYGSSLVDPDTWVNFTYSRDFFEMEFGEDLLGLRYKNKASSAYNSIVEGTPLIMHMGTGFDTYVVDYGISARITGDTTEIFGDFVVANNLGGQDIHITTTSTNSGIRMDGQSNDWTLRTNIGTDFVIRDETGATNVVIIQDGAPTSIQILATGEITYNEYDGGTAYSSDNVPQGSPMFDSNGKMLYKAPFNPGILTTTVSGQNLQKYHTNVIMAFDNAYLPSASSDIAGKIFIIQSDSNSTAGARTLNVSSCGSNCIESNTTLELDGAYETYGILCTGTTYTIIWHKP